MIFDKFFPGVDGIMTVSKFLSFFCGNVNLFITLADIDGNRHDAIISIPFL